MFVCRYLFALQIKQDISSGRLTCNDTSAALMVSHIIQCKYLQAVFSFAPRDLLIGEIAVKHYHAAPHVSYLCCYGSSYCVTASQPQHKTTGISSRLKRGVLEFGSVATISHS